MTPRTRNYFKLAFAIADVMWEMFKMTTVVAVGIFAMRAIGWL